MPYLLPENEIIWQVYSVLGSQVRVAGLGSIVGYDYGALEVLFVAYEVQVCDWAFVLEGLHLISTVAVRFAANNS